MPTKRNLSFDELCAGNVPGYSFNVADLTAARRDMRETRSYKEKMLRMLEKNLFDTVEKLEEGSRRTIAKIYVGKTYIEKRKNKNIDFHRLDPSTWVMTGIGSRFRYHHHDKNRDGLVVLGAITRETLPLEFNSTQKLALSLEDELTSRCKRDDERIEKETYYSPGKRAKNKTIFCVYIAYRYATEEEQRQGPVIRPPRYSELEAQLDKKSRECQDLEAQLEEKSRKCQDWEAQVQELKDKLGDYKEKVKVKEEPVEKSAPAPTSNPKKKQEK